ncbi:MAG: ABC transporter permease, partial [Planktothrix sp.]
MTVIKPSETTPKTRQPRSLIQTAWRQFKRDKIAVLGLIILGLMILAVIIGPWIYGISPTEIDFVNSLSPPTGKHLFGTNDLGQDQLARLLIGGRVSLTVGVAAMAIAILLGTLVGAIAGFYGGIIDSILMRLTDLFISLPQLPVLLLVIYLFREAIKQIVGPEVG